VPIWENSEFRIMIIQCIITWTTLLVAIIMCTRSSNEKNESHEASAKDKKESTAKKADSKPKPPMLNFVTVDEIYEMPLEVLQSVPKEHLEQLPMDKREIVRRRINDLVQAERIKKNK